MIGTMQPSLGAMRAGLLDKFTQDLFRKNRFFQDLQLTGLDQTTMLRAFAAGQSNMFDNARFQQLFENVKAVGGNFSITMPIRGQQNPSPNAPSNVYVNTLRYDQIDIPAGQEFWAESAVSSIDPMVYQTYLTEFGGGDQNEVFWQAIIADMYYNCAVELLTKLNTLCINATVANLSLAGGVGTTLPALSGNYRILPVANERDRMVFLNTMYSENSYARDLNRNLKPIIVAPSTTLTDIQISQSFGANNQQNYNQFLSGFDIFTGPDIPIPTPGTDIDVTYMIRPGAIGLFTKSYGGFTPQSISVQGNDFQQWSADRVMFNTTIPQIFDGIPELKCGIVLETTPLPQGFDATRGNFGFYNRNIGMRMYCLAAAVPAHATDPARTGIIGIVKQ